MAPEVHSTGCRKSGQSSSGPCLLALTAEKPENGFEGVSSDRREPKAISSPSLPSAFIFVLKWLGLLTHTHFF